MIKNISKYQVATIIAIVFHCIGLTGLLFFDKAFFIRASPFNLLLSFFLLVWTETNKNKAFLRFVIVVFSVGFLAEVAGVNTGLLFGDYSYGQVLGIKLFNVPLLIGINWFIIIYCCGLSMVILLKPAFEKMAEDDKFRTVKHAIYIVVDGALLAVLFDWIMEPVAIKLGFWAWAADGHIPVINYFSWLLISLILLIFFVFARFTKRNKFAFNLLLIQVVFFLILRMFLK